MDQQHPQLVITNQGDATVVRLADRKILDEASIAKIGDRLQGIVDKQPSPRVVLDFSDVGHMSSSALGMLIRLNKRIQEKKGQLRFCGIQAPIYEVFVITRLNEIFEIRETLEEAVASLS